MNYRIISSSIELTAVFPIISELRPHLTLESFIQLYEEANKASDYQLMVFEENHQIIGVMGYRILTDFVHGRHFYIDDLVTTHTNRSKGLGSQMLQVAEHIAKDAKCSGLRLCTGIQNENGKKFYEKNNWQLKAVAYKKKLD